MARFLELIKLQTRDTTIVYRGPSAPVTSVAVGGNGGAIVFGGCWDKDIWSWDRESGTPGRRFKGHSDFVKTITCVKTGGIDASTARSHHSRPCKTDLKFVDSHIWWCRQKNPCLGYSNWRASSYPP